MLRLILYSICSAVLVTAITYRDCVPKENETSQAIFVSKFEVVPKTLKFPGNLSVSVTLNFSREVKEPIIDFELTRYLFGFPLKLPCRDDTVVGTCNNINICWLFNRSLHDHDPKNYNSYGHKLERMMNKTTGKFWECPIEPVHVVVENEPFELSELSSIVHLLADGDYTIKVIAKEYKTGPIIGCIEVNATITGSGPGSSSIFG